MKLQISRPNTEREASAKEPAPNAAPGTGASVFLSGVAVLSLSTVLVKILGLFYKIPMLHYLGSEGMGYFNAAYEWYATLCVLSTAGLPLASSMLIAQARASNDATAVDRIEKSAFRIFFALGAIGSLLLFFGAGAIARLIGSPQTKYAIAAVAPTLLFSCLSASYRGYFQGHQNMLPTAVSQMIEALGKLIFGVAFAILAWRRGMSAPFVAARAMLGLDVGVATATLYLMLYRNKHGQRNVVPAGKDKGNDGERHRSAGHLLAIAVPITVSSSVLSVSRVLDMALILRRLQGIGYDVTAATALYGSYTTLAVPVFNLIPSLISSVSLALIPSLKGAIAAGDAVAQRTTTRTAVRLTALLSLPASFAVALYSRAILHLLFRSDLAAADAAAPLLSVLGVSIFFSGMITTTNAILHSYGHTVAPIVSMISGAGIKLACAYVLIGLPGVNIYGAPISTLLCDMGVVGINLALIARHTDVLGSVRRAFGRPLVVSAVAVGVPGVMYALLLGAGYDELSLFFAAVPVTLLLFSVLCLRIGLIGDGELALLPRRLGKTMRRLTKRLHRV